MNRKIQTRRQVRCHRIVLLRNKELDRLIDTKATLVSKQTALFKNRFFNDNSWYLLDDVTFLSNILLYSLILGNNMASIWLQSVNVVTQWYCDFSRGFDSISQYFLTKSSASVFEWNLGTYWDIYSNSCSLDW